MDTMTGTLAALHTATGGELPLVIAGGFGLYLKQQRLSASGERTLFPREQWPVARATEDIDLLLRAEVATDSERMGVLRAALDELGFEPIESARYYQFVRTDERGVLKIDLLAGPLGEHASKVPDDARRVRPRPSVQLHARRAPEALGVDEESVPFTLETEPPVEVLVPTALTFVLMKLGALSDRSEDAEKDYGRHHALDLYRCVAMLTPAEDEAATRIRERQAGSDSLAAAQEQVETLFGEPDAVGLLRLREHELLPEGADIERFVEELRLLTGSGQRPTP